MAKSALTDAEKAELSIVGIMYIHEQLSQILPGYAADMEALMHRWVDAGILAAASKAKIKAEITADSIVYKAKGKK
jgi:hypothetical protein